MTDNLLVRSLRTTGAFAREIVAKRELIVSLSVRNFKSAYLGSILGVTWVVVEPLLYVLLLWFFFTKAFRFSPPQGYSYVPWLMTSMALWNFFSLTLASSSATFRSHAFLLKRPEFNLAVLPLVNILTALYVHGIFLVILIVLLLASGVPFTLYWFQAVYYLAATAILLLGLAWIVGSLGLFVKDIANVVGVVLQVGFWVSPIFWSVENFPANYRPFLQLNPLAYLLEGYRGSFLRAQPFWIDVRGAGLYWSFTALVLLLGVFSYRKLRPHFGDVV